MRWVALVCTVIGWLCWLYARFGGAGDEFTRYAFMAVYLGAALVFFKNAQMGGSLGKSAIFLGIGYSIFSVGEIIWMLSFEGVDEIFWVSLPYYIASLCFAIGAYRLFMESRELFGFSRFWITAAVIGAFALVSIVTLYNFYQNPDTVMSWQVIVDSADNAVSAFSAMLIISTAILCFGGLWQKWLTPLAFTFGFVLIANVMYTLTLDSYTDASLSNWLWLIGASIVHLTLTSPLHTDMNTFGHSGNEEEDTKVVDETLTLP